MGHTGNKFVSEDVSVLLSMIEAPVDEQTNIKYLVPHFLMEKLLNIT